MGRQAHEEAIAKACSEVTADHQTGLFVFVEMIPRAQPPCFSLTETQLV